MESGSQATWMTSGSIKVYTIMTNVSCKGIPLGSMTDSTRVMLSAHLEWSLNGVDDASLNPDLTSTLTLTPTPNPQLEPTRFNSEENMHQNARAAAKLAELAKARGITPGQLALAYVHNKGRDVFPIPGTKSVGHTVCVGSGVEG